ncbi:unnamed protein product [Ectocarpus sp. 8 AP-2014]
MPRPHAHKTSSPSPSSPPPSQATGPPERARPQNPHGEAGSKAAPRCAFPGSTRLRSRLTPIVATKPWLTLPGSFRRSDRNNPSSFPPKPLKTRDRLSPPTPAANTSMVAR